jgi:TRAP-type C4-dicarboxylate transport system permease small subunit
MPAFEKALGTVATGAGLVGGVALLGLMFATVIDVALRSTLNVSLLGITEITELGLVLVAILGIAYCGWTGGHVAIEFGDSLLSAQTWSGLRLVEHLASAAIAGVVAYYGFVEAAAVHGRNAHTNLLQIPEYPFYLIVGLGFLTYALILVVRAFGRAPATPEQRP